MKQEKTQPALREPIANSIQFEHDDMNAKMPQICVCVCVMPAQLSQQALPPSGACVCVCVCVCVRVCVKPVITYGYFTISYNEARKTICGDNKN